LNAGGDGLGDSALQNYFAAHPRAGGDGMARCRLFHAPAGSGVVLTTGRRSHTYADRLHVMPIDRHGQPTTLDKAAT
jgi:hypothetical protein